MRRLLLLAAVLAIAAAGLGLWLRRSEPSRGQIAGMVRQTEIRVASDTTGRLASIAVAPGQRVRKGDLLAVLANPDLVAQFGEAKAAADSARADRDRVNSGVREEQVQIAAEAVQTGEANLLLAKQQYERAAALANNSFASQRQLDESTASLAKAQADLDAKTAQAALARAGPTAEERALADARVALADATLAETQARLAKTRLTAPADGTVGIRVAETGEIIGPGKPVLTLNVDGDRWFAFTLREDALGGVDIGSSLTLTVAGGRKLPARVTELLPLGEFATWRAARAAGDHDLNAFRLRLDPEGSGEGLEPGMTIWLPERR
ncbi:HlyD family secretion protein [Bosea sp. BIWAKO-01]|uniref:HlyD family secretion protein n=1 Tax=Bosea sp. BIWAKO-01 TaxID=506668 RepID=UPI0008538A92|nr:HlyD family secretion protein [Bosea sp. BIWAKO-01]GAU85643.1 secretion protein HlyD family protein [Bosea sp. BIWAKO-01]